MNTLPHIFIHILSSMCTCMCVTYCRLHNVTVAKNKKQEHEGVN